MTNKNVGANCVRPEKGITLIALVITIIIMLILVAVSVSYSIKSGLFSKAKESKEKYARSEEKEIISLAVNEWNVEKNVGTEKTFFEFMEEKLKEKAEVTYYGENAIIVEFKESKICYKVEENGSIECLGTIERDAQYIIHVACMWGDSKTGEKLKEYEVKSFFSEYKIKLPQIEGYEKSTEILEGSMPIKNGKTLTETTVNPEYYKIIPNGECLIYTDIDENTCMIGDGSTNAGNALDPNYELNGKIILTIPEVHEEKKIVQVGDYAFKYCKNIIKAVLENNVERIGIDSFRFTGVKEIVLGKKLEKMGSNCFGNCSIKKVVYNNENNLFSNSANQINGAEWTILEINEDNKVFKVIDNVMYSKDGKTIIRVPTGETGEFIIKNEVTTISDYAFYQCSKITKLAIENNVETIGVNALRQAGMKELIIGKNVKNFGADCFSGSSVKKLIYNNENNIFSNSGNQLNGSNWTELEVNEDNEKFKAIDNVMYSKDGKTIVRVPTGRTGEFLVIDEVEKIGAYAFYQCNKITKISTKNIKSIGKYAFRQSGLQEIVVEKNIDNIEEGCFSGFSSLKTLKINSNNISKNLSSSSSFGYLINNATTIYIKEGITDIGQYVIDNFTKQASSDKEGYSKYVKN